MAPAGRRAGNGASTRRGILDAARVEFGAQGYAATTIRAVARRADVDPALVYHYFGDKPTLYVASLNLPGDPRVIRDAVRSTSAPGVELVARFLRQFEPPGAVAGQNFVTMAQAISSSPEVARSMREFLTERVWIDEGEYPEHEWSRAMISALLAGLAWSRYLMRVEPVASASIEQIAERFGPSIGALMGGSAPPA